MLSIPPEKLADILAKARELDPENPHFLELVVAINSLSESERAELLALIWLGCGDYERDEWREAVEEAGRINDEKVTDYLFGTPPLCDCLEAGLAQLGYAVEDFEISRG